MSEIEERTTGVGALIVVADTHRPDFLTIEETRTKRSSGKLKGMRSLPMETVEDGETHQQALARLLQEEVRLNTVCLAGELIRLKLGRYELTPGVVLHAYVIEAPRDSGISVGSGVDVQRPEWTSIEEVLATSRGSLRFRPGVKEIITTYLDYLQDKESFQQVIYSSDELANTVPNDVYDLIDQGTNETEALSQLGLAL